jgi:hypothetical protein
MTALWILWAILAACFAVSTTVTAREITELRGKIRMSEVAISELSAEIERNKAKEGEAT